jgi:hypothetical protein
MVNLFSYAYVLSLFASLLKCSYFLPIFCHLCSYWRIVNVFIIFQILVFFNQIPVLQRFFQVNGLSFYSLNCLLQKHIFYILMKITWSNFSFIDHVFGNFIVSKHYLSPRFSIMFSNSFAFKPVIYFDLNFVKGVKSFFFFCMWISDNSSTICWKVCPFCI